MYSSMYFNTFVYLPTVRTQQFITQKNLMLPLCSQTFSPHQLLANTDLFSVPIDLPFPECHTQNHRRYNVWRLASFSVKSLRFGHVAFYG